MGIYIYEYVYVCMYVYTCESHTYMQTITQTQAAYQDLKMRVKKAIPHPFATMEWYIKATCIVALCVYFELGEIHVLCMHVYACLHV